MLKEQDTGTGLAPHTKSMYIKTTKTFKSSLKAIKVIQKERKKANCHSSMHPMILKFFKVEI